MKITADSSEIRAMKKRLTVLENKVTKTIPLMRGSIVTNGVKHRQPYLSFNKDKRTRLMYLGEKRVAAAQKLTENYKRMWGLIEEMTLIHMELLKNDAFE